MGDVNSYEEVRKKRVQDNLKQLEKLGVAAITNDLAVATKKEHKPRLPSNSEKKKRKAEDCDIRRSSRARNTVVTYTDEFFDPEPHHRRVRRSMNYKLSKDRAYKGRIASYKQRLAAIQRATTFQENLNHPSFIKAMVRSYVFKAIMVLPTPFGKAYLPESRQNMVLEDENGEECDAVYVGKGTRLGSGWRGFALEHNLKDGDALIFELIEHARFKVYIFKAVEEDSETTDTKDEGNHVSKMKASKHK